MFWFPEGQFLMFEPAKRAGDCRLPPERALWRNFGSKECVFSQQFPPCCKHCCKETQQRKKSNLFRERMNDPTQSQIPVTSPHKLALHLHDDPTESDTQLFKSPAEHELMLQQKNNQIQNIECCGVSSQSQADHYKSRWLRQGIIIEGEAVCFVWSVMLWKVTQRF